jgi:hypothetical protein
MELSDLLENKKNIKIKLFQLKKEILELENELKSTDKEILQKCNHNWISQGRMYKYGDISYLCSICGFEK